MKKYIALGIIILSLGAGWVVHKKLDKGRGDQKFYRVYTTTKTTFENTIEVDGIVEARDTKLVYADRSLKVDDVIYKEGDYVKEGEIIMTFDPEDKNKTTRELRKEKIELTKLRRDLRNALELHEIGGMSKVDKENLEFDIETSLINIEDYEEELAKMLDYIVSPFDGTIISMIAEENYRVNTEVELFEMANLSDIIIVAEVPEYSIDGVEEGQKSIVKLDAYKEDFIGVVTKISTLSTATTSKNDTSSSSTPEAYVEVEIEIKDLPSAIRPGFNSTVDIVTSSKEDIITVPRTALLESEKREYIVLLEGGNIAKKLFVKTGESSGSLIQIKNLDSDVKVLIDPDTSIEDGDLIYISDTNTKEKRSGRGGKS